MIGGAQKVDPSQCNPLERVYRNSWQSEISMKIPNSHEINKC